jgi:uncharacterized protein
MMFTRVLIVSLLSCSFVCAADSSSTSVNADPKGPPTEASIKQMLEVMQAHKMLESVEAQMVTFMKQTMGQATQGQPITPQIQKDIDRRQTEMLSMFHEFLNWEKLEPMYVRVYQKSFTQGELTGIVDFYKTPAGQAMIAKMPVVMQNTMGEMQQMMQPVMLKVRQQQQEVLAEIKAEKEKGSKG